MNKAIKNYLAASLALNEKLTRLEFAEDRELVLKQIMFMTATLSRELKNLNTHISKELEKEIERKVVA